LTSGVFNPQGLPYIPPRSVSPYRCRRAGDAAATARRLGARARQDRSRRDRSRFCSRGRSERALLRTQRSAGPRCAAPGTFAPFDVPTDNFTLLNNYLATFLGGQPCLSGAFEPYNPAPRTQPCLLRRALLRELTRRKPRRRRTRGVLGHRRLGRGRDDRLAAGPRSNSCRSPRTGSSTPRTSATSMPRRS
jgi:hypothetical protein